MQAYCMKCRAKREMRDAKSITMKNGRPATQGICPVLQNQDVQNWQELGLHRHSLTELRRAGFSRCQGIQSFCFTNHT